eukprot:CAMPEP_0177310024 /NCGR_PEP_ID=MMETSP0368-20130122/9616_1 /TAXON_ID=447022 ORGANISM="Scrippsiella hangoei-like, Strain SHHI-4" /NCGR_SAMPLE_ID=MMETSP0368 /ASSEMBLY_ACC=CAM_ASM_000363 /LENGTH=350 /DNA_ID=CAMNT_0018768951 /DNA_START=1 /DNA_END=1050 /DNA_ORIENTATION=-
MFFKSDTLDGPRKNANSAIQIPPFDIPGSTHMADFRARVEQLPDLDNPQSFGMAPNADRSLQRINSTKVIAMLRTLAAAGGSADGGGGGGNVDIKAWKAQLGPLFQLWDTVSKTQLSKVKSIEVRNVTPDDPPVVAFVLMDSMEAGKLGDRISNSLTTMQKVIAGTALSTPDIIAEAKFLIRSEVPPEPRQENRGPQGRLAEAHHHPERARAAGRTQRLLAARCLPERPAAADRALAGRLDRQSALGGLLRAAPAQRRVDVATAGECAGAYLGGLQLRRGQAPVGRGSAKFSADLGVAAADGRMARAAHPDRAVSSAKSAMSVSMPIYVALSRERLIGEVVLHTDSSRQR